MKRAEKKEHLVRVAQSLFNRHGYHAVGVDQITAAAGIAKTTLYRHFKSKEDLIVAVLHSVDEQTRDAMRQATGQAKGESALLDSFDFLKSWFESADFYGCPFMGAAKEYCDPGSPVRQEAVIHKRLTIAYFEELARQEGFRSAKAVAEAINLLHEGAISVAQITRDSGAACEAKVMAERILAASEKSPEETPRRAMKGVDSSALKELGK